VTHVTDSRSGLKKLFPQKRCVKTNLEFGDCPRIPSVSRVLLGIQTCLACQPSKKYCRLQADDSFKDLSVLATARRGASVGDAYSGSGQGAQNETGGAGGSSPFSSRLARNSLCCSEPRGPGNRTYGAARWCSGRARRFSLTLGRKGQSLASLPLIFTQIGYNDSL